MLLQRPLIFCLGVLHGKICNFQKFSLKHLKNESVIYCAGVQFYSALKMAVALARDAVVKSASDFVSDKKNLLKHVRNKLAENFREGDTACNER